MVFWNNVKQVLRERGMTQEKLATDAGVSFRTLQGWVSKDRMPRGDQGVAIARALGVPVEDLLVDDGHYWGSKPIEFMRKPQPIDPSLRDSEIVAEGSAYRTKAYEVWALEHIAVVSDMAQLSPDDLEEIHAMVKLKLSRARAKDLQSGSGS
jgi:transcriptional regulator with XRE-family HTH domain